MKTIHDLIKAIHKLGHHPSKADDGALSARVITEPTSGGNLTARFRVKIGSSAQRALYAEADPVGNGNWQEELCQLALDKIKAHDSELFNALSGSRVQEQEIKQEYASPRQLQIILGVGNSCLHEALKELREQGNVDVICTSNQRGLSFYRYKIEDVLNAFRRNAKGRTKRTKPSKKDTIS